MELDATNIRIANKVNELISEAQKFYSKVYSDGETRTMILDRAWSTIVTFRQNEGANDTLSVCAEHFYTPVSSPLKA